jgi:hypothetical protein
LFSGKVSETARISDEDLHWSPISGTVSERQMTSRSEQKAAIIFQNPYMWQSARA